jgi:hypothetical protein
MLGKESPEAQRLRKIRKQKDRRRRKNLGAYAERQNLKEPGGKG